MNMFLSIFFLSYIGNVSYSFISININFNNFDRKILNLRIMGKNTCFFNFKELNKLLILFILQAILNMKGDGNMRKGIYTQLLRIVFNIIK